ncbi:MAG: nucleotidyltransferase domain-containing protein [Parcubacteria group bacterium]|nr:nucleotidyltransferase domain-containing protein [Parcubacteria group bacterium]MCR4342311.1 nucleotidyltransferase domain-containing protein [Patescibacteria group bacterium]
MNLSREQKIKLADFAEANGIKFIVLFGSQSRKTSKKDSDFDIAVLTTPEKSIFESLENYNNLLFGLSAILEIPDYKFDLTDLNNANILLRYEIVSSGQLLFGDEIDYLEFKSFATREYIDAKRLFDLEDFLIKKKQRLLSEVVL